MPVRVRKLVGLFVLLGWLAAYALFMTGVAIRVLPGAHWAVAFAFYAVAGLSWVLPLKPLIRWMQRPDPA